MRFKEFSSNKKTLEANPALSATAGAIAQGAKNVGNMAVQGIKNIGQTLGKPTQSQQAQQPIKLKPGMKILLPKPIGDTKIKSIQGNNAVLDTQKTPIGLDVTVDQDELLATLGQSPEQNISPGSKPKSPTKPGMQQMQQGTLR